MFSELITTLTSLGKEFAEYFEKGERGMAALIAWEAWTVSRDNNEPLPEWAAQYFDRSARALIKDPDPIPPSRRVRGERSKGKPRAAQHVMAALDLAQMGKGPWHLLYETRATRRGWSTESGTSMPPPVSSSPSRESRARRKPKR